jgi:hypothetical protein
MASQEATHPNASSVGWLALACAGIFALASTPFWLSPLVKIIGTGHSDQIATSGVIVASGGLVITLWQLVRTRGAAVAAASAVASLELRLRAFEDYQLCANCRASASEIERGNAIAMSLPVPQTYVVLPSLYRGLRTEVTELRSRLESSWSREQRTTVQDAVSRLQDAEINIPRFLANSNLNAPRLTPLHKAIQKLSQMLTQLSVDLNQRALGGTNETR